MNRLKEFLKGRKNYDNVREKRKSFFLNSNINNFIFNKGINIFNVSDLIMHLIKLKKHFLIK